MQFGAGCALFPVTAAAPDAQRWFNQALRLAPALIEDGPSHMEPLWRPYPVGQPSGALRLQAGQPEDAAQMFRASLLTAPNNAYALLGLAQAEEKLGDHAAAASTLALLAKAWTGGATMPELDWM